MARVVHRPRGDMPMHRLGAIDVGSNAFRLLAVEVEDTGRWTVLARERAAIRLGADTFADGRLSAGTIARAQEALARFRQRLAELGVGAWRAVATSAVRESRNPEDLVAAAAAVGVPLEVIDPAEEVHLVWQAVRHTLPLEGGEWALVDLGGGSLEIAQVRSDAVVWCRSLPAGAVRLRLICDDPDPVRVDACVEAAIARVRWPAEAARPWAGAVAVGGNIEALARLAGARGDEPTVLSLAELAELRRALAHLRPGEIVRSLGLAPDRADVVLPAAAVYLRLGDVLGVDAWHVPFVGVREGLIWDQWEALAMATLHRSESEREAVEAALAFGRRCGFDEDHARRVAAAATHLFEVTAPLHRLPPDVRRWLLVAALLHDVGRLVNDRRHHKHSAYLIRHADLPGLKKRERRIAALVARYHRGAAPKTRHRGFGRLEADEQQQVRQLAALLRLADALDTVADLHAELIDGDLVLRGRAPDPVRVNEDLDRKGRLFRKIFARDVVWQPRGGVDLKAAPRV